MNRARSPCEASPAPNSADAQYEASRLVVLGMTFRPIEAACQHHCPTERGRTIEDPSALNLSNMYRPGKSFGQDRGARAWRGSCPASSRPQRSSFAYENGAYGISQRETLAALVRGPWRSGPCRPPAARHTRGLGVGDGDPVAVFGVFTAASGFWANSAEKAFEEGDRVWLLAGIYLLVVFLSPPGSALFWVRGLGLGVTAVGALALVSRLWPHLFSADRPDRGPLSLGGQAAQLPGRATGTGSRPSLRSACRCSLHSRWPKGVLSPVGWRSPPSLRSSGSSTSPRRAEAPSRSSWRLCSSSCSPAASSRRAERRSWG